MNYEFTYNDSDFTVNMYTVTDAEFARKIYDFSTLHPDLYILPRYYKTNRYKPFEIELALGYWKTDMELDKLFEEDEDFNSRWCDSDMYYIPHTGEKEELFKAKTSVMKSHIIKYISFYDSLYESVLDLEKVCNAETVENIKEMIDKSKISRK